MMASVKSTMQKVIRTIQVERGGRNFFGRNVSKPEPLPEGLINYWHRQDSLEHRVEVWIFRDRDAYEQLAPDIVPAANPPRASLRDCTAKWFWSEPEVVELADGRIAVYCHKYCDI